MVSRIRIPSLKDVPIPRYSIIITLFLVGIIITMYQTGFGNFSVFLFIAIPLYICTCYLNSLDKDRLKKPIKKNKKTFRVRKVSFIL
ncbi:CDP-diacylglycerol--serine O-phosphatidyltransferase [Bacillus cereus]|nr:CDP-diacylglycerol--serine O-phosphatidyltransferase [Bacillus cereus]